MTDRPETRTAPLWAVLALSFVNSIGTGVITNGLFFLTAEAYGFGRAGNFALALVMGMTYIVAASSIGPLLRHTPISARTALLLAMAGMGLVVALPLVAARAGTGGSWCAWIVVGVYTPLAGVIWPVTEGFLSGGRDGHALRRALGRFNITWSVALVICFWLMGPFVAPRPLEVMAVLGLVHVASILLLMAFPPNPAPGRDDDGIRSRLYVQLLGVFRILLPSSYIVLSAVSPWLPSALAQLGVAAAWRTPLASAWLAARLLAFALMERWHGWRGRWAAPVCGGVCMVGGLVGCVACLAAGTTIGFVLALTAMGFGLGIIYAGALYYAMAVGRAEVGAGGTHEALIGLGYTVGPLLGLTALGATPNDRSADATMVLLVGGTATLLGLFAMGRVKKGVSQASNST